MSIAIDRSQPNMPSPSPFRWTVDAMYRAIDAGVFDHPERIELINGELIEKMGQNPPHASFSSKLTRRLRAKLEPPFNVREDKPLHISEFSEPEPDIMVVTGDEDQYDRRHPRPDEVVLLIEVADSSVAYDTGEKAVLYAQAGIPNYWIILLVSGEVIVNKTPRHGEYLDIARLSSGNIEIAFGQYAVTLTVEYILGKATDVVIQ